MMPRCHDETKTTNERDEREYRSKAWELLTLSEPRVAQHGLNSYQSSFAIPCHCYQVWNQLSQVDAS